MTEPADAARIAQIIQENRQSFETLSKADLPISENVRRALEWLDGWSSHGGGQE
jgi:hypothetical protein